MNDTESVVEINQKQSGRFRRGVLIAKSAWRVFKLDKELGILAGAGLLASAVIGGVGLALSLIIAPHHMIDSNHVSLVSYVIYLVTLMGIGLLYTYSVASVVAASLIRFRGGDPNISDGITAVKRHLGPLSAFALVNTGVGQLLKFLQDRLPLGGKILAFLADTAWNVANIFSIPVIVDSPEAVMPLRAVKRSVGIIKQVWAEGAVGQFSIGAAFLLLLLLEIGVGFASILVANRVVFSGTAADVASVVLSTALILALVITIVLSATLSAIVKAALYHYATTGEAPEQFNKQLLREAFDAKKGRKVFV